jgi:hypothetical protein
VAAQIRRRVGRARPGRLDAAALRVHQARCVAERASERARGRTSEQGGARVRTRARAGSALTRPSPASPCLRRGQPGGPGAHRRGAGQCECALFSIARSLAALLHMALSLPAHCAQCSSHFQLRSLLSPVLPHPDPPRPPSPPFPLPPARARSPARTSAALRPCTLPAAMRAARRRDCCCATARAASSRTSPTGRRWTCARRSRRSGRRRAARTARRFR